MMTCLEAVEFLRVQAEGLRPYAEICEEEGIFDNEMYIEWDKWNKYYIESKKELEKM